MEFISVTPFYFCRVTPSPELDKAYTQNVNPVRSAFISIDCNVEMCFCTFGTTSQVPPSWLQRNGVITCAELHVREIEDSPEWLLVDQTITGDVFGLQYSL